MQTQLQRSKHDPSETRCKLTLLILFLLGAALILGGWPVGAGAMGAGGGGTYERGAGAASTSQRTLTIIIKFDRDQRVRDFAYHTSRF